MWAPDTVGTTQPIGFRAIGKVAGRPRGAAPTERKLGRLLIDVRRSFWDDS
jgi:hypothetical protein